MGIISYRIKQNLTIYIGEVLARRGHGSLTTNHSCPTGRIAVATNFKKFSGKYLCWSRSSVMFQAASAHLGKSGLHHACFPRNLRTAIFRNISEQLFQLFSQTFSHRLLQDTTSFLQYLLFFIFALVFTFPCTFA